MNDLFYCWGCGNEVVGPFRDDDTTPCCDYGVWHGERDERMLAPLQIEATP